MSVASRSSTTSSGSVVKPSTHNATSSGSSRPVSTTILRAFGSFRPAAASFQSVQSALARQGRAVAPPRRGSARHRLQRRVPAQILVVVQILIAQRQPVEALQDQGLDIVNHQLGPPVVGETGGYPSGESQALVGPTQQG